MNALDVKNMISDYLAEQDSYSMFDHLFNKYLDEERSNTDKHANAMKLWEYMKSNTYIPQNLNSDEDLALAQMLNNISIKDGEVRALSFAIIILHHRFMLSNILERSFAATQLLYIFMGRDNHIGELTNLFCKKVFSRSSDYRVYQEPFERKDVNPEAIRIECMRAVLPYVLWQHENIPSLLEDGVFNIDFLRHLEKLMGKIEHQKKALPKFSAFGKFFYEIVHETPEH